jgi:hypothetical protein
VLYETISFLCKTLFWVSIFIAILSVPLMFTSVREYLLAVRIPLAIRTSGHRSILVLHLARRLVAAFYERAPSRISKKKIFFIALISSMIVVGYLMTDENDLATQMQEPFDFLVACLSLTWGNFIYEFLVAFMIVRSFKNYERNNLSILLIKICVSLILCLGISMVAAVVASKTFVFYERHLDEWESQLTPIRMILQLIVITLNGIAIPINTLIG